MQLGYARVSTPDQSMDLQKDALEAAGVKEIFEDVGSGVRAKRTGLERLLVYARPGDTVVVWRLDRLGRSLRDLVGLISDLQARGVAFRSLQENIDTTTASGKLFLHVLRRSRSSSASSSASARSPGSKPPPTGDARVGARA